VATDTVTGYIDNGSFSLITPTFISFADSSKAYVCSFKSHQVGIIDVSNQTMTGYIDQGAFSFSFPYYVSVTSDSAKWIVTNILESFKASIGDTATDTIVQQIDPLNDHPRQLAISADNSTAYLTNLGEDSVSILDLATDTLKGEVEGMDFPFNKPFSISIAP
jgi:DNA-binding beta-propeller fold protein YncE